MLDAAAVTALRTGAAAVLAAETLGRGDAASASVVGAGVNGRAAARTFWRAGETSCSGTSTRRGHERWSELGPGMQSPLEEALAADLVVTMTPGHELALSRGLASPRAARQLDGRRRAGQGRDRPAELVRTHMFCDDWEQASHNGELVHAVEAARSAREQVTELGAVLTGESAGRRAPDEVTTFDSTGLAIQDLAIALAAFEAVSEVDPRSWRSSARGSG